MEIQNDYVIQEDDEIDHFQVLASKDITITLPSCEKFRQIFIQKLSDKGNVSIIANDEIILHYKKPFNTLIICPKKSVKKHD